MFFKFKSNFEEVFMTLVPGGDTKIEFVDMLRGNGNSMRSEKTNGNGDKRGIRVNTSFEKAAASSATTDKNGVMMNLSPGQKTIISISIIIALQKCNSSPFYCFDEIDADLDSHYVQSLSKLISNISKDSQVFLTTFRPETIEYLKSSTILKVDMVNGESVIYRTTNDEAKSFLARR